MKLRGAKSRKNQSGYDSHPSTESPPGWWNPAELRLDAGSLIPHQSQTRCLQIATGGLFINAPTSSSCCGRRQSQTVMRESNLLPPQVGCYSLWQCGVCGLGPTAGTLFFKAVNIGYETAAYEPSVCESNSRCSSWTTKGWINATYSHFSKTYRDFCDRKKGEPVLCIATGTYRFC